MSSDRLITERKTYGLGEMLGEIGGLNKSLEVVLTIFLGLLFKPVMLYAKLASLLYRDEPNEKEQLTNYLSLKNKKKDVEDPDSYNLKVPLCIDLRSIFFCCCFRPNNTGVS
jgi:hypothetical protein